MVDKLVGKCRWIVAAGFCWKSRNQPGRTAVFPAGFRAISVLRDFYTDTTEDAYLMQFCLTEDPAISLSEDQQRRMAG